MTRQGRFVPPLWYPGTIGRAVSSGRAGILASLLPVGLLAAILAGLWASPSGMSLVGFVLAGPATALPTWLLTRRLPDFETDGASIIVTAMLFPVWGAVATAVGLCVFAPFTCTAFWAMSLWVVLLHRRAWHFFLLQSAATLSLGIAIGLLARRVTGDV